MPCRAHPFPPLWMVNKKLHACSPEEGHKRRDEELKEAMQTAAQVSFELDDCGFVPSSGETFDEYAKRLQQGSVLRAIPSGRELHPALRFSCTCVSYSKYAQCPCSVAASLDAKLVEIPTKHDVSVMGRNRKSGRPANAERNHFSH